MSWLSRWFKKKKYLQNEVFIYEETPSIKIAYYDGQPNIEKKHLDNNENDTHMTAIKKEQKGQLNVYQIKNNLRKFHPNEFNRQKSLFDHGSIIHVGDVSNFYGKTTKAKRFFYNKRKNIV